MAKDDAKMPASAIAHVVISIATNLSRTYGHQQAWQQQCRTEIFDSNHPKIGCAAIDRHAPQAAQDNRRQQQTTAALLRPARQLFNGKHHPAQRRVGGDGNICGYTLVQMQFGILQQM